MSVVGAPGHAHLPLLHAALAMQVTPHSPQFSSSFLRSLQPSPQQLSLLAQPAASLQRHAPLASQVSAAGQLGPSPHMHAPSPDFSTQRSLFGQPLASSATPPSKSNMH